MTAVLAAMAEDIFACTPAGFAEHRLERDGCPLHYWTGGRAGRPVIACLHGALMDHRMFNAQIAAIQGDFGIVLMDARGHGRSQPFGEASSIEYYVADLLAVLDALGIERAILVGQSLGGYIVQHMLRLHPERAQAAVIIGSTPIVLPVKSYEMAGLRFSLSMFGLWPYRSLKRAMARATAVRPETLAYALGAMDQVPKRDFLIIWRVVTTTVRREGYPEFRLEIPLLLTHGEHDQTGTIRRDAPRWAALDPNVHYQVIPNAGHNANQDNPQVFNQILRAWLAQKHFLPD